MGYGMKRGAAPKFKELGSSPLEYEKDPKEFVKRKSGPKVDPDAPGTPGTPGYESEVKSTDYLTKKPNPTVSNPNLKEIEKVGTWNIEKQQINPTEEGEGFEGDNPKVQYARRNIRTGTINE